MGVEVAFPQASANLVLNEAIRLYAPDLLAAGVRVGLRFCTNSDGDAVTHGGYPCFAKIAIVPAKWRLSVPWDAVIEVDQTEYSDAEHASRLALFHHELNHLKVVEASGRIGMEADYKQACELAQLKGDSPPDPPVWWKTDYLGRPKLKTRKGDWNVGDGFCSVIEQHGPGSIEYQNIKKASKIADEAYAKYIERQLAATYAATSPTETLPFPLPQEIPVDSESKKRKAK